MNPSRQLIAAWTILSEEDIPLNPRILGKPGVGKTTLAYTAAKMLFEKEVYIFQCTMDTRPEDLIIQPVINESNKIDYHASPLVTAMIKGGICILDEGNRMSEKSWASLAPLLDKRRYVESIIAGIKIKAHKDFRIAVTMNTDSSTFEIPEYIDSRLQPKIYLDFPDAKNEFDILKYNVPFAEDKLIEYIVMFLQDAHKSEKPYSVRDGINIARYYYKLKNAENKNDIKNAKNNLINQIFSNNDEIDDYLKQSIKQILDNDALDFFFSKIKKNNKKKGNSEDFGNVGEGELSEGDDEDDEIKSFEDDESSFWNSDEPDEDFDDDFLGDKIEYEDDDEDDDEDVDEERENQFFFDADNFDDIEKQDFREKSSKKSTNKYFSFNDEGNIDKSGKNSEEQFIEDIRKKVKDRLEELNKEDKSPDRIDRGQVKTSSESKSVNKRAKKKSSQK
jgi:MoxR-like ATPase